MSLCIKNKTLKIKKLKNLKLQFGDYLNSNMDSVRYNEAFLKMLGELKDIRTKQGDVFRAKAYQKAQETIMILLDADDAFAGPEIISHVRDVVEEGIEVADGGMLRLDKQQHYPADFVNPRTNRGGNVWQHLKCFRKRCIDIVPIEMFRLDDDFIHDEDDWALMLPIVEVSNHHHQFIRPMMIYTISENKLLRSHDLREKQIERIVWGIGAFC